MSSFFEIVAVVLLVWILVSIGFGLFWSVLKRREPTVKEPEDVLAGDS